MSGTDLQKFRDFVDDHGTNVHISGEKDGELQSVKKTLFGRPFKGDKEIETNLKITDSFRKALVKEYGERVTQWAFSSSSYDDRMLKAKPLSGYRIQQIIDRAEEAKAKDGAKLEKLLPQWAPVLLEKSMKEAGIDLPEKGSEEWQSLVTGLEDEIRQSPNFQNTKDIKGNFDDEFGGVVDKFVQDLKELPNPDEPAPEVNDEPEMTLESEGSPEPSPQNEWDRWNAKDKILKKFGLDDGEGSSFDMPRFGITTGEKSGYGGFSEVFPGTFTDPDTKEVKSVIVKEMSPPMQMSRERGGPKPNEAMAMYLVSSKHENYSQKVHIVPPSHYMISIVKDGQRQDQLVKPGQLREILKDPNSIVVCQGLLMEKAPGQDVSKLITGGQLTEEWEKKQYIKGTLESIKGLNERGFVHRDLKPANTFFDKKVSEKSGTATLIDTGMLFKTPKNPETEKHPQYGKTVGGTLHYMHPRALNGQDHGTETDLYALGVMALEVDHPEAFGHLKDAIQWQNRKPEGITREWLLDQVEAGIKKLPPEIKELEPEQLEAEIKQLEPEVNQLKEEIKKLGTEIKELRSDNTIPDNEKSARLKDLEARRKDLEASLKEPQARLNVLKARKDLEALHKELKDPNSLSLSSFAMDCFAMAGQPALDWHDRETSQKWYSELLDHQVFK